MKRQAFALAMTPAICGVSLAMQQGTMSTPVESFDGNQRDISGPQDVTDDDPSIERIFLAAGRRRIAHEVFDRERQFFEEEFGPQVYPTDLLAVEVDEDHELLFTLTGQTNIPGGGVVPGGSKLHVQDIQNPVPENITVLELAPHGGANDIHVIPEDQKLLVVRGGGANAGLTVWDYSNPVQMIKLGSVNLPPGGIALGVGPCTGEMRTAKGIGSPVVQIDGSTRRVFLTTAIDYGPSVPESYAKGGRGILAADLSDYGNPFLYPYVFDPLLGHCLDPFEVLYAPRDWATHDIALFEQGSTWYLCAGGSVQHQLKVFDLTSFSTIGFDLHAARDLFVAPGVKTELQTIDVVGTHAVLLGRFHSFAADLPDLTGHDVAAPSSVASNGVGHGPARDTLVLKEGLASAPETKVLNVSILNTDYRFKVFDASQLPEAPQAVEAYYAPGDSDSACYIPEYSAVYCTNFNGIILYDVSQPSQAIPDYGSYVPAVDEQGNIYPIEHMISAYRPWDATVWHLFGNSAVGGFWHWGINPEPPHHPVLMEHVDGKAASAWPAAWDPAQCYGQDQEYGTLPDMPSQEIVMVDYYNLATTELAINHYNLFTESWGTPLTAPPGIYPTPWDVCLDGEWVFVGAEFGFFAAHLDSAGVLTHASHVITDQPGGPVAGYSYRQVRGIGRVADNRIVVSLADGERPNRFALALYAFDPVSGVINPVPRQVLFDGANSQPDHFPGIYITGGGRLRTFKPSPAETLVFTGTGSGHLVQVSYQVHSDSLVTHSPLRYWHNGSYFSEIADCQISNVAAPGDPPDLRLVLPKWRETFAIVAPTF